MYKVLDRIKRFRIIQNTLAVAFCGFLFNSSGIQRNPCKLRLAETFTLSFSRLCDEDDNEIAPKALAQCVLGHTQMRFCRGSNTGTYKRMVQIEIRRTHIDVYSVHTRHKTKVKMIFQRLDGNRVRLNEFGCHIALNSACA